MTTATNDPYAPLSLATGEVFPVAGGEDTYLEIEDWDQPVTFFVGRNGSGKSRTAKALAAKVNGRFLSTDRLVGLMSFTTYRWGSIARDYKGVPISDEELQQMTQVTRGSGSATEQLYALKEQPDVWLRVAAFIRRALGRDVELRESAGYLDPYVRVNDVEYSLLRDEGHGLRELVVLLAATYRSDWKVLIIDEPELHLHPSMVRLWMTELIRECAASGRRSVVVTHEPSLVQPVASEELRGIWLFQPGEAPRRVSEAVLPVQLTRVTRSMKENPSLLSQLIFSPRPVLVEGPHDAAAFTTALSRTHSPEVVAQTQFVECGGSGGVSLWLEISKKLGLDAKAIADLDAAFSPEVTRVMDADSYVTETYRRHFSVEPPQTSLILRDLIREADRNEVAPNPRARARWLADELTEGSGFQIRRDALLKIWRHAGLWLHPQGTLEDVLGISEKGVSVAREAASNSGDIDAAASWCAFELDPNGDVELLLNAAVERIAHSIMEAQRTSPDATFSAPVGSSKEADSRLVSIEPGIDSTHRIVVRTPADFCGYWLEFSRSTPSSDLKLRPPLDSGSVS